MDNIGCKQAARIDLEYAENSLLHSQILYDMTLWTTLLAGRCHAHRARDIGAFTTASKLVGSTQA